MRENPAGGKTARGLAAGLIRAMADIAEMPENRAFLQWRAGGGGRFGGAGLATLAIAARRAILGRPPAAIAAAAAGRHSS